MGISGVPFEKCHSKDEITNLIKKHEGKISYVSKELGCCYQTLLDYMERHPDVKQVREEAQKAYLNKRLDNCETALDIVLSKIHTDPQNALKSAIYTLNNLGKSRGYAHEATKAAEAAEQYKQELLDKTRNITDIPSDLI